jgi:hypothetical protein
VAGAQDSVEKSCDVPAIWANPNWIIPNVNRKVNMNRNLFMVVKFNVLTKN